MAIAGQTPHNSHSRLAGFCPGNLRSSGEDSKRCFFEDLLAAHLEDSVVSRCFGGRYREGMKTLQRSSYFLDGLQ